MTPATDDSTPDSELELALRLAQHLHISPTGVAFSPVDRVAPASAADTPPLSVNLSVTVDQSGAPAFDESQRRRWGMVPGAEFEITETVGGILLRRVDPPLTKVYVEPTSRCNLDCRTCVRHSWREPVGTMSRETWDRLIEGLRDVPTLRTVAFWGFGEPLLHPNIAGMIAQAKALGARTELITNALLLDRTKARALVEAGLDQLVVSVDGATPAAQADVRSGASLDAVIANVEGLHAERENLGRRNPEIGLEFVMMKSNVGELPQLRSLAGRLDARFIVLTNVLAYSPELRDEVLYGLKAGRSYQPPSRWTPEVRLPRVDHKGELVAPLMRFLEGDGIGPEPVGRDGQGAYCRFVNEGSAVVAWDGELSPCVALMHSYTVYVHGREKRIRRYTAGNVASSKIGALWQQSDLKAFRGRVRDFAFSPCTDCGACDFAETNEQDCFGNTFPTCGDCLWAKGAIQCP